jgi:hypothetical protein
MAGLVERASALFRFVQGSPSQPTHFISIRADHTDSLDGMGGTLAAHEQYFEARINELYLTNKREWFINYDPMAIALAEFRYAGQPTAIPFIVGPSMIQKIGNKLPQGMVFADTRVAGPQPYRGDGLALTVILCRLKRDDMLRRLLRVVESTSKTLDFTGATAVYTKVANAVLDGIEEVTGAADATTSVLGWRQDFRPVECGFYALIDGSVPAPPENRLWVRKRQLVLGDELGSAEPFRTADYVLFSISSVKREDVSGLPFYPTYIQAMQEASQANKENDERWESAKVKLSALYSWANTSPDLTRGHAKQLKEEWKGDMVAAHDEARKLSSLGPGRSSDTPEAAEDRRTALDILNL